MTIPEENKREMYAYIYGIIKNLKCHLIRMNGIGNHIHMLVDIHPAIAVADFVQKVKQFSSRWAKESGKYPMFTGWGEGYYAVSLGTEAVESCVEYIKSQEEHHAIHDFTEEVKAMAEDNQMEWYEGDWK